MNLQELQIAVLDTISDIIDEPVVNRDDIRDAIVKLFEETAVGQEQTP